MAVGLDYPAHITTRVNRLEAENERQRRFSEKLIRLPGAGAFAVLHRTA